ncbi:MAG: virulence RhuM family protein [Hyphomicrobiales bacterium]|nr:virulence RhuM family protein [Hyphomicrobiales bacterium]
MSKNKSQSPAIQDEATEFLLYTAPGGGVKVEVILNDETIWLTQQRMADLFGVNRTGIGRHLKNIFESEELDENVVCAEIAHATQHGAIPRKTQTRSVKYYNLDAVISVGYRVNSAQATQFRIWATRMLKEYIIKGFAMDDERLKNGRHFGKDYFEELLERVRSIRASERRIYQQITDIFAECSIDYDPTSETAKLFYAHVQDKFHYAITGQTSSEKIYHSADSDKPLMGMMTFKNAPDGRVLRTDAAIGRNYLSEDEIRRLERIVPAFFDYIEGIIKRRSNFTMEGFADSVNKFLEFNEYQVLEGYGKVTRKQAEEKAFAEYEEFNKKQKIESDFDKQVKALEKKHKKQIGSGSEGE